jgi:hypothetical protein
MVKIAQVQTVLAWIVDFKFELLDQTAAPSSLPNWAKVLP